MTTQPLNTTSAPLDPDVLEAFLGQLEGSDLGRQLLFQSLLPAGATPTQSFQFQGLFSPTFTQYLGTLGQKIRAGEEPDLTFDEYLAQEFDPTRALLRLPGTGGATNRAVFNF